jgi:hypothetical protein
MKDFYRTGIPKASLNEENEGEGTKAERRVGEARSRVAPNSTSSSSLRSLCSFCKISLFSALSTPEILLKNRGTL